MAAAAEVTDEHVERNDYYTVIDVEHSAAVRQRLENLPSLSRDCCIFRVPRKLRSYQNETKYEPQVVSIGPLHHGKHSLVQMEEHKNRFLRDFLRRTELRVEDCLEAIRMHENRLRSSYSERIDLTNPEFVEMMLCDSAFIIELFLRYAFGELENGAIIPGQLGNLVDIRNDLCLLENQVPFFILEVLFDMARIGHQNDATVMKLALLFLGDVNYSFRVQPWEKVEIIVRNFVDLLRFLLHPHSVQHMERRLQRTTIGPLCATELQDAGIKLQKAQSSNSLLEIRCRKKVLEIPTLAVDDSTELLLRNVMAFEQCSGDQYLVVTDYVVFLYYLIKAPADAELLSRRGIIENDRGDYEELWLLFRDLTKGINFDLSDSYFCDVIENLNRRSRNKIKWKRALIQGLIIFLNLALIQTICSIIQVYQGFR